MPNRLHNILVDAVLNDVQEERRHFEFLVSFVEGPRHTASFNRRDSVSAVAAKLRILACQIECDPQLSEEVDMKET